MVAGEHRPWSGWHLGDVQVEQGLAVDTAIVRGFIDAQPAQPKDASDTKLGKGIERGRQQDRIVSSNCASCAGPTQYYAD